MVPIGPHIYQVELFVFSLTRRQIIQTIHYDQLNRISDEFLHV